KGTEVQLGERAFGRQKACGGATVRGQELNGNVTNQAQALQRKLLPEQGLCSPALLAWIEEEVSESLRVKQEFLQECAETLVAICAALAERFTRGGKLLLFGNGGSAADAQHIAAEFVGRYQCERAAI